MNKQEFKLQSTWIAKPGAVSKTCTIPQSLGKDIEGRKIVVSGTVIPANDATAEGILVNDVDVTNGDKIGAKMVAGYVYKERLPETPSEEAVAALKDIRFWNYEG